MSSRTLGLVQLCLSLFVFVSCRSSEPPWTGFRTDTLPSGIPHAINRGAGLWTDSSRWSAEISFLIGGFEGIGPELFGAISALAVDEEGRLYVADSQMGEVRLFDATGSYVRTLARRGDGPGEVRVVAGLRVERLSNLWIWDPRLARFTVLSPDGDVVRTIRHHALSVPNPWPGDFDEHEYMIDWQAVDRRHFTGRMRRRPVFLPIRVYPDRPRKDTLAALSYDIEYVGENVRPFSNRLTLRQDRKGHVWFGMTRDYRLYRRTLKGDTTLMITLEGETGPRVSEAAVDSILQLFERGGPVLRTHPPSREDLPATKAVLRRLLIDDDDHLFVFPETDHVAAGSAMDVFDAVTGAYLGRVDLPVILELTPSPVVSRSRLCGVTTGTFDVQSVVCVRVGPGPSGR